MEFFNPLIGIVFADVTIGFDEISSRLAPELEKLENLIVSRKGFEGEVEILTQWLNNSENLLNTELKTTSLSAIQDQLDQVIDIHFIRC